MTGILNKITDRLVAIVILAIGLTVTPALAQVERTPEYYLSRAINSLTNNDIDAADKHFRAAQDADNNSAVINLRIGELYIEYAADGYSKAFPYLSTALTTNPTLHRARLLMGQAHFHQEVYSEAVELLEPLLHDAEYGSYAGYYLGIIDYRQRMYVRARARLESVMAADDAIAFHESAKNHLEAISIATNRWSVYGIATARYDSNPQIISDFDIAASELNIEKKEDYALILQGQGSYTLHQQGPSEVIAQYQLYDIRYDRLSRLNQQGHILGLESTYYGKRSTFNLAYAYEYWTVDNEKLQQAQRLSTVVTRNLTPTSETKLGYRFSYSDRYDDPTRSGPSHRVSIDHLLSLTDGWRGGIGYAFEQADTDQEHESRSSTLNFDVYAPEFHRFNTQFGVNYEYEDYPKAKLTEHRERESNFSVSATTSRVISEHLHLRLGVRHERNRSDQNSFTYDRYQLDIGLIVLL